jgi:hypothetical protein
MVVVVSAVLLAACSGQNPLFQLDPSSGSETGGTQASAGETSGVPTGDGPTGEPSGPTSDGPTSAGPGGETTAALTSGSEDSGPPQTSGTSGSDVSSGMVGDSDSGNDSDVPEPVCGDGNKDPGEECDDGAENGSTECSPACHLNKCGDDYVAPNEACDNGEDNGVQGDCTKACAKNKCGDGETLEEEACDAGPANGKEAPGCSHDCKAVIGEALDICTTGPEFLGKVYFNNMAGLAGADSACETKCMGNYKAMLATETRVASKLPYAGMEPGWVVKPYTAYSGEQGLIFVTGPEGLLGVRDGADAPLLSPLGAKGPAWTGLNPDWTRSTKDCVGWTSKDVNTTTVLGDPMATVQGKYLAVEGPKPCSTLAAIYCVQQ